MNELKRERSRLLRKITAIEIRLQRNESIQNWAKPRIAQLHHEIAMVDLEIALDNATERETKLQQNEMDDAFCEVLDIAESYQSILENVARGESPIAARPRGISINEFHRAYQFWYAHYR